MQTFTVPDIAGQWTKDTASEYARLKQRFSKSKKYKCVGTRHHGTNPQKAYVNLEGNTRRYLYSRFY